MDSTVRPGVQEYLTIQLTPALYPRVHFILPTVYPCHIIYVFQA